jgi:hypothetical protein
LGRQLSLVVAESKAKLGCELVPITLGYPGDDYRPPADGTAALKS